jgi:cellulose synthase/poly-beta-1,6-N-acetylglucosamine synthase-like glycosyltransferase
MTFVGLLMSIAVGIVALPMVVICVECVAAILPRRAAANLPTGNVAVDVLIPAHNEEMVLEPTLAALQSELAEQDRVWVIADNSTDGTAAIARRCGVGVFERHDLDRRGKGYALDFALQQLAENHADVIVIVDADCRLSPGSLRRMAALAHTAGRPVQARYTMSAVASAQPTQVISQFAVLVKNVVRPLGLSRLGLPCLLTGSGMAFPWSVIESAHLATGNIVEDMNLTVDLMLEGHAPIFCAEAGVSAVLPVEATAVVSQRTRWEHGHLQIILTQAPRLFVAAVRLRRPELIIAALDIAVPPLSLLAVLWALTLLVSVSCGLLTGEWLPAGVATALGTLFLATTLVVNHVFSPSGSWKTIAHVPLYVVTKIPIYIGFLWKRQTSWVRTARATASPSADQATTLSSKI